MDLLSFTITGLMVYAALAVFFIGMTYRIFQWFSTPKASIRLGMFPKPKTRSGRWLRMAKDTILFPQTLDVDATMWFMAITFHIAGLFIFFGHLRLIKEFTPIITALGSKGMDTLAFITGGTFGVVITVVVIYYLIRRFASPYKDISVPEDYLLLILILLIITMGNHLRFFGNLHVADYRAYVQSVLMFRPSFDAALAHSSIKWSLVAHVFLANILLMYFPFSKLTHTVGAFAANLIRSD